MGVNSVALLRLDFIKDLILFYLILFKVVTGLFFHPQLSSRPNLENKVAPNFTMYAVAALQWFYHWRTRRTF